MSEGENIAAVVGVTGGAGATRLCVEMGATLARAGDDVAVFDAAYATQGLSQYVRGRIEADLTDVVTDDADLADALVEVPADVSGRLVACPVHAAFETVARAKTAGAAERFAAAVREVASDVDHVLVDAAPVASNQTVAAVDAADRVALVAPATRRGVDGLQLVRGRVADVGGHVDLVVANRAGDDHPVADADVAVPGSETAAVAGAPVCEDPPESPFPPAVATACEELFGVALDLSFPDPGPLEERLDAIR